jgi:manganese/zinc/iron transport system permease protein
VNPYTAQDFFSFFVVLCKRIVTLEIIAPVSDEIQCLTLILLGISLSFLGSFLVVRKMTMLANALSHTLLVGIVIAFILLQSFLGEKLFSEPFASMKVLWIGAILTGFLTTLCTELLTRVFRVQEDASIGLVFTTLFALGVFLVTLYTRNVHLGVEAIMGNIDALHIHDLYNVGFFALITFGVYLVFFRGLFTVAFDTSFAKSICFPVNGLNYLLMIITAGGAIAAFRVVGVLLFLALLVGPVLVARLYTPYFKRIILYSSIITAALGAISVALSRHILTVFRIPLSTSGIFVTLLFLLYITCLIERRYRNKLTCKRFPL